MDSNMVNRQPRASKINFGRYRSSSPRLHGCIANRGEDEGGWGSSDATTSSLPRSVKMVLRFGCMLATLIRGSCSCAYERFRSCPADRRAFAMHGAERQGNIVQVQRSYELEQHNIYMTANAYDTNATTLQHHDHGKHHLTS